MFSKITSLALLATGAAALATPPSNWAWHVTGFSSDCTAATCYYSFRVTAPGGPNGQPGFTADNCRGSTRLNGYEPCNGVVGDVQMISVRSQEVDSHNADDDVEIDVEYSFPDPYDMDYLEVYTGYIKVHHTNGAEPVNFDITTFNFARRSAIAQNA